MVYFIILGCNSSREIKLHKTASVSTAAAAAPPLPHLYAAAAAAIADIYTFYMYTWSGILEISL